MRVKILTKKSRNGDTRNLKKLRNHIGIDMLLSVRIPNENPMYTSERPRNIRIHCRCRCRRRRSSSEIVVVVELQLSCCCCGGDAVGSNCGKLEERRREVEEMAEGGGSDGDAAEDSHEIKSEGVDQDIRQMSVFFEAGKGRVKRVGKIFRSHVKSSMLKFCFISA